MSPSSCRGVSAATQSRASGPGAIGQLVLYPLLLFAGLRFPEERMPPVLQHISEWPPPGASVHALQDSVRGTFPSAQSLLILAGWAVLFGFPAVRFFRWEQRRPPVIIPAQRGGGQGVHHRSQR